jgi:molecular chaperone DnaK
MDNVVIQWIISEFKKAEGIDLSKDSMAYQRVREAAERAKIELSTTTSTDINLRSLPPQPKAPSTW